MTKQDFAKVKEGQLLTITKNGIVLDIFHYSKVFELHHHNYNGENYYYLNMSLQPKLEQLSITTEKDINALYERKKQLFEKQLKNILELKKEI